MKPQKKVINERASEYDISVAFPFSAGLPLTFFAEGLF
jgi:hypothetical protein